MTVGCRQMSISGQQMSPEFGRVTDRISPSFAPRAATFAKCGFGCYTARFHSAASRSIFRKFAADRSNT